MPFQVATYIYHEVCFSLLLLFSQSAVRTGPWWGYALSSCHVPEWQRTQNKDRQRPSWAPDSYVRNKYLLSSKPLGFSRCFFFSLILLLNEIWLRNVWFPLYRVRNFMGRAWKVRGTCGKQLMKDQRRQWAQWGFHHRSPWGPWHFQPGPPGADGQMDNGWVKSRLNIHFEVAH